MIVAALLRGVNVGGRSRVSMAALRDVVAGLGHTDVATLLQSGNVLFRPATDDLAAVASGLEEAIARELDVRPTIVVVRHRELRDALAASPFADEPDGSKVHLVLLTEAPDPAAVARLDPHRSPGDRFVVDGRVVHLHLPRGAAATKLTGDWLERSLQVRATARNRNTVEKLAAMTAD